VAIGVLALERMQTIYTIVLVVYETHLFVSLQYCA
jgi:hypothetical protein